MSIGLLVNYAGAPHEISSLYPDSGLAALAASLIKNGHGVTIFDYSTVSTIREIYKPQISAELKKIAPVVFSDNILSADQKAYLLKLEEQLNVSEAEFLTKILTEIKGHIETNKVSWIGFKLWMKGMRQVDFLARELKKTFKDIRVFGGGPNVDIFQEYILKQYDSFDILTFAEADHVLPLLGDWIDKGANQALLTNIPSLIYREDGAIKKTPIMRITSLDELPYPTYDTEIYPAMANNEKMHILCFDESRGCPMGCAFCPDKNKYGKKRIEKSVERCIEELKFLKERYKVDHFRFSGSNTSIKLLNGLSDKIIAEDLKIKFSIFSSGADINEETIAKLAQAGLFGFHLGLESADDTQRKKHMHKGVSLKKIERIISASKEHNLFFTLSIIYPGPFSTEEIYAKNLNFIVNNLKGYKNCSIPIYPAGLYPSSTWMDRFADFGFALETPNKEEYISSLLEYDYNIILPRYLWKSIPYTMNGLNFTEMLAESARLTNAIKKEDILTYLVDATIFPAAGLGYSDNVKFAQETSLAFFCR